MSCPDIRFGTKSEFERSREGTFRRLDKGFRDIAPSGAALAWDPAGEALRDAEPARHEICNQPFLKAHPHISAVVRPVRRRGAFRRRKQLHLGRIFPLDLQKHSLPGGYPKGFAGLEVSVREEFDRAELASGQLLKMDQRPRHVEAVERRVAKNAARV